MGNIPIAFLVLGAFFTLYVVAATWKSQDAPRHTQRDAQGAAEARRDLQPKPWWRARRRSGNAP